MNRTNKNIVPTIKCRRTWIKVNTDPAEPARRRATILTWIRRRLGLQVEDVPPFGYTMKSYSKK